MLLLQDAAEKAQAAELATTPGGAWDFSALGWNLINVAIFGLLGVVIFGVALWLITNLAPFSVKKEIEEDQNTALAVVMGAILIGLAIILAAAIAG
ncbi:MAG: DUF350 domain-containing protein [Planctomycetota bacterium]|jgi:uncharacterized membrane protein YjfL (UPF0719 family)